MLFPTIQFALFFPLVLVASWLTMPRAVRWKLFILAASYLFYAAWDWRFVGLLLGVTVISQLGAVAVHRARSDGSRRRRLAMVVAADLAVLAWFKYYGFFATSLANLLDPLGLAPPLPLLQIVLPVGISFFTFQAISYVVDVYRRALAPASPIDAAVYLAFFPQLVAGPIVRATEFLPQLRGRRDPRRIDGARAFLLIATGLFKKVVVANVLATTLVDPVFASPASASGGEILAATYGYAVQIYADFSGYTDIAIGCALLLGFTFPDNFDRPYAAVSLQEFWRRWHMTLSRWLRDYLYIPLGGSSGGPRRTVRNLLLTMLLGGLWHGAAWTFVVWGAIHGLGLAVERRHGAARHRIVGRLVTFHVVCLAWIFFRAGSLPAAATLLWRLLTAWGPAPLVTPAILAVIAAALAVQLVPRDVGARLRYAFSALTPAVQGATLGLSLLVIDALGPQGVAPFIYFQF
ncbi:MAG: MBOAT family protein [Actinomycetota bacterium]|jgi:D-alanyl-lipoteichoic acid acyltransferase DltB (MBOAT superfamily)|nr:MBOAT family protein [Actinomycetota bacterium]